MKERKLEFWVENNDGVLPEFTLWLGDTGPIPRKGEHVKNGPYLYEVKHVVHDYLNNNITFFVALKK